MNPETEILIALIGIFGTAIVGALGWLNIQIVEIRERVTRLEDYFGTQPQPKKK